MSGYVWRKNGVLPASEIKVEQLDVLALEEAAERLLDLPNLYSHGQLSARGGQCRRGCCWNPWSPGVCHYKRRCKCHHTLVDEPARILGTDEEDTGEVDYEELMAA